MANPSAGNRFVSVNLNKSYGRSSHSNRSNTGNYGSGRGRSAGVGSGMVVLSRPRSSHKAGQKLSVPPPLNLPSIRKEHERFDSLGPSSGTVAGGIAGNGARPSSSGMGWSKPSSIVATERDGVGGGERPLSGDGVTALELQVMNRDTTSYVPPSAKSGSTRFDVSAAAPTEKATVLKGEDFPSLRATLTAVNGLVQKQKDSAHPKQSRGVHEGTAAKPIEGSHLSLRIDMRPHLQPSQRSVGNVVSVEGSDNLTSANSIALNQDRKQDDYFPGPLPLVQLGPRSDWADDERDTGHGLTERGKEHGYSTAEAYWDRDFDCPRGSFLPHKPGQTHFVRRGLHDNDVGKGLPNEVSNAGPFNRDVRVSSREHCEGHSWRMSASRNGYTSQEASSVGNSVGARSTSINRETTKENKYIQPQFLANAWDEHNGGLAANRDPAAGRREPGYVQGGRQHWNNSLYPNSGKGGERDRYGNESNRYNVDTVANSVVSRPSFSAGNKGLTGSNDLPNFGRDKRSFSKSERQYVEDSFLNDWGSTGFDGQDPFPGSILGLVKRKKDANKHLDIHDPVRESFEAELERVQKIQEQERLRIIEEQERAMEMARREEEERQRLAREQEEHQRKLEEEAREAAWREEQEKQETLRRAEEQRVAREEEKQRILMEEGRRKQAAKQKLLELEERIARRQAETAKGDNYTAVRGDILPGVVKERDDFSGWEDGERMVERITNTASSDSSSRPFDMGSRPVREGSISFTDRGKPFNSWRREAFENENTSSYFSANHENGHHSPRQDASFGGRAFPQKDFYNYMPMRGYYRAGNVEHLVDDFSLERGHRWNVPGDLDPCGRGTELEAEFHDNIGDKFGGGWSEGRGCGSSPLMERLYQTPELNDPYTYGRSRYSARQPRVLPPPSLPLVHRTSFRNEIVGAGSSSVEEGNDLSNHTLQSEPAAVSYQNDREEHSSLTVQRESAINGEWDLYQNATPGCDSQSSLSVSSPPSSPTHLSHDDLDESRDSLGVPGTVEGPDAPRSENEVLFNAESGKSGVLATASSISIDDDEEWTEENNEELQEQEEYDEDVGYHDEDGGHEGDDMNVELRREFHDVYLEEKGSSHMDNLVLGFDQGVEVGLPNDECEVSSKVEGSSLPGSQATFGVMEHKVSLEGSRDDQGTQVADVPVHVRIDSPIKVPETEKAVQDYIFPSCNASHTSTSFDSLNSGDPSSGIVVPEQQSAPSPVGANSLSPSQAVMPGGTGAHGVPELPVKLQFGLFSGPPLIPSVPAIQIGSIQMPLQFQPQIGPSFTHMHALQPPLVQFGQLRYSSPISPGVLPLVSPSMFFVQPNMSACCPSNEKHGGPQSVLPVQDSSDLSAVKEQAPSFTAISHCWKPPIPCNDRQDTQRETSTMTGLGGGSNVLLRQNHADVSSALADQVVPVSGQQVEKMEHPCNTIRNSKPSLNNRALENRKHAGPSSAHSAHSLRDLSSAAVPGELSGSKGRRFASTSRNTKLPFSAIEGSRIDANRLQGRPRRGTQRYEFRVRQGVDGKQSSALLLPNNSGFDGKTNSEGKSSGIRPKSGLRKEIPSDKPEQASDSVTSSSVQIVTKESGSGFGEEQTVKVETPASEPDTELRTGGSLKRNIGSEDYVDAPLQSGIVRIFKQPGIEVPSDEDDFIEVRSKKQLLNDRREQREKATKAKSSNMRKSLRKSLPKPQGTAAVISSGKTSSFSSAQATKSICTAVMEKQSVANSGGSAFNNIVSQSLASIGVNANYQADVKAQTIKLPRSTSYSTGGQAVETDRTVGAQSNDLDGVHSSTGPGCNSQINKPVMALTQIQLEEAMKPVQFDMQMVSVGDKTSSVSEPGMASSSVLSKDSPFCTASSPVNSLLAGEKIQFGAVTSPTILPPNTRVVSHGSRPPASHLSIQVSHNVIAAENDSAICFEREKHSSVSCPPLEDCEAEAEAAASAVAAAAIANDDMVGNGIDGFSASISCPNGFDGIDLGGITAGMPCEQQPVSRLKGEDCPSVSLPADLSVETPPISLWPPLPSLHSSSNPMLSPFLGGPNSHFPFYEMSPMVRGPVFAFGPHEESAGAWSQPENSGVPDSAPLGTWQQCHTGVDSFYGSPAGFTAPFPPGSISGVQGPQHMVVYNHFAPVGQFGQVGLSYMGSAYIPSGKQPDWKHNTTSSAMDGGEGEANNLNMLTVQCSAPNVPAQVQHLVSGSPFPSMASPMASFEVSPFQNSADPSVHLHWSHVQASSLPSLPQSMPLQLEAEATGPSQFNSGSADCHPLAANGFTKPQTPLSLENDHLLAGSTNAAGIQFSDELRLMPSPASTGVEASTLSAGINIHCGSDIADSVMVDAVPEGSRSKRNPQVVVSTSSKGQLAQQKNQPGQLQHSHYQRGSTQRNVSGTEWSNRKVGFHGRNHSAGGERGCPTKVKQVYVAKQISSGTSTAV